MKNSNDIFPDYTQPISFKSHIYYLYAAFTKTSLNGPYLKLNMTTMPTYGKTH